MSTFATFWHAVLWIDVGHISTRVSFWFQRVTLNDVNCTFEEILVGVFVVKRRPYFVVPLVIRYFHHHRLLLRTIRINCLIIWWLIFTVLIDFFTLTRTLNGKLTFCLLWSLRIFFFNLEYFGFFFVCVSLPSLRFMDLLAQYLMVLFCFLVGRVIAFNNLNELCKELLSVSTNVRDSSSFHVLLN